MKIGLIFLLISLQSLRIRTEIRIFWQNRFALQNRKDLLLQRQNTGKLSEIHCKSDDTFGEGSAIFQVISLQLSAMCNTVKNEFPETYVESFFRLKNRFPTVRLHSNVWYGSAALLVFALLNAWHFPTLSGFVQPTASAE